MSAVFPLQGSSLFAVLCLLLVGCGAAPTGAPVASLSENTISKKTATSLAGDAGESALHVAKTQATDGDSAIDDASEEEAASPARVKAQPIQYTVRKSVTAPLSPAIPPVLLSAGHKELCKVGVGQLLPELNLPQLGGQATALSALQGKQATVVLFWHPDRWMARTALVDMQRDIASKFPTDKVAVVGIAVKQTAGSAQEALNTAQATFPQLLDADGTAFAAVGSHALPRIYVLDPGGTIVWFDIEYSEATRRELGQTLTVLTKP